MYFDGYIKKRGKSDTVPVTKTKPKKASLPALNELDRVVLTKAVQDKGNLLARGLTGTIVLCHGAEAYEVEFDGIEDFFQIAAEDLAKAP